jgi:1-acyl-sn-glycerol-3-phosphate acyltransferase
VSGLFYAILWLFFKVFGRVFLRYRTIGQEHIPRKGGVLFAANHASYSDIPLLGCGIPRRVTFLGRASLFPNRFFYWALRSLGWIPLKTDRIDRKAFGEAISCLKAGKPVVIFPEGTRSQDGHLKKGKPGIGVIVAETQCPVIPAFITGSRNVLPMGSARLRLHPVTIHFGEPIVFSSSPGERPREFYEYVSTTVMTRIAELGQVPYPYQQESLKSGSQPSNAEDEAGNFC